MAPADSLASASEWLALAAKHGFSEVQLNLCWHPLKQAELEEIKTELHALGLRCPTVGIYCDLLRFESHHFLFKTSRRELEQTIAWLPEIGAANAVAWSGSYADDLLAQDRRNQTKKARQILDRNVERVLPLLQQHSVRLLIEPWHTHVLGNEIEIAKFCRRHPGQLGCVLDIPNLIRQQDWARVESRLYKIVNALRDTIATVHLKDMMIDNTENLSLPPAGKGDLDYATILKAIRPFFGRTPFIIEHVLPEQIVPTVRFLRGEMERIGYPVALAKDHS